MSPCGTKEKPEPNTGTEAPHSNIPLVLWAQIKASIVTSEAGQGLGSIRPTSKQRFRREPTEYIHSTQPPVIYFTMLWHLGPPFLLPGSGKELAWPGAVQGLWRTVCPQRSPRSTWDLLCTLKSSLSSYTNNQRLVFCFVLFHIF